MAFLTEAGVSKVRKSAEFIYRGSDLSTRQVETQWRPAREGFITAAVDQGVDFGDLRTVVLDIPLMMSRFSKCPFIEDSDELELRKMKKEDLLEEAHANEIPVNLPHEDIIAKMMAQRARERRAEEESTGSIEGEDEEDIDKMDVDESGQDEVSGGDGEGSADNDYESQEGEGSQSEDDEEVELEEEDDEDNLFDNTTVATVSNSRVRASLNPAITRTRIRTPIETNQRAAAKDAAAFEESMKYDIPLYGQGNPDDEVASGAGSLVLMSNWDGTKNQLKAYLRSHWSNPHTMPVEGMVRLPSKDDFLLECTSIAAAWDVIDMLDRRVFNGSVIDVNFTNPDPVIIPKHKLFREKQKKSERMDGDKSVKHSEDED